MCGRFILTYQDVDRLASELQIPLESFLNYRPRYNVAPGQRHWIVRTKQERREAELATWGLINRWSRDGSRGVKQINARAETIDRRPAFRDAFRKRRSIVPADGFFEWAGQRRAWLPIWYHRADGGLILLAGLYQSWQPSPDVWELTFTIITTKANAVVERVHDRMPVILLAHVVDEWLDPGRQDHEALKELLVPAPDQLLIGTPVSPRVNSVRYDDPACVEEYVGWCVHKPVG